MCEALAVLFAVPASHCVDDMIGIDLADVVRSGWESWRALAKVSGWEVGDDKSPPPSQKFVVIGVDLDMSDTPVGPAVLSISGKRVAVLTQLLHYFLSSNRVSPGEAFRLLAHWESPRVPSSGGSGERSCGPSEAAVATGIRASS